MKLWNCLMSAPLDSWTGAGLGEGVTTSPLYARTAPDFTATQRTLWPKDTPLLLWHAAGNWYYVSDVACTIFGWSHGSYITRTLGKE